MSDRHHSNGFTMIEMLVVLGIIVVLAAIVITVTLRIDNQSKERALDNAFALVNASLREYYELKNDFPRQDEFPPGIPRTPAGALSHVESMWRELRTVPDARHVLEQLNPGLIKNQEGATDAPELRDPWGTVMDYVYDPNVGDSFPELISAGPDKRFETEDDIGSKGRAKN